MFEHFLAEADIRRVETCLATLRRYRVGEWALTGGVAIELRLTERAGQVELRSLNDLDFATASFDTVPDTLGTEFLVRHVHPLDPPNKMIAQFVSSKLVLRVDVFRTDPEVMKRTNPVQTQFGAIHTVSFEDLVARAARLILPIARRQPVLSKHVNDFLRLVKVANLKDVERAWPQHRCNGEPESFEGAAMLLCKLIPQSADLLTSPAYSQNPSEHCSRCATVKGLELASGKDILSILGYC